MFGHGGKRVGAGPPRKNKWQKIAKPGEQAEVVEWMEPLDYMMAVVNDPKADRLRRDRMAIAAAPYRHARVEERVGKKELKQDAAEKAAEKFAVPAGPKLIVHNKVA